MAKKKFRHLSFYYWVRKFTFSNLFQKIFFIPLSYKRRIVFKSIFKSLHWRDYKKANDNESVSGLGSDLKTCEKLIEDLSLFIQKHKIKSILDLACGDFNWMRYVINANNNISDYCGLEIVDEIVLANKKNYASSKIKFFCLDVIKDEIPKNYDLVIIRDFFIHIKNEEIKDVLEKIIGSNARFFGINTFPIKENVNLKAYGHHRDINIELKPFNLDMPYLTINDYDRKFNIYKNNRNEKS